MIHLFDFKSISISLYLATGTLLFLTSPSLAQFKDSQEEGVNTGSSIGATEDPFDFAGDGRSGRRTSGGSRGECPKLDPGLIALVPTSNWGKTVAEYPTWWFYVPYSPQEAPIGVFVLQDKNYNDLYRTTLNLPSSAPGLVSVSLPKEETSLTVGNSYRWQLNLYCSGNPDSAPVYVSGWINRVLPSSELARELTQETTPKYQVYAEHQIWFDAVHHLGQLRITNPSDPSLIQDWQMLLKAEGVDLDKLKDAPVAGQVKFVPSSSTVPD